MKRLLAGILLPICMFLSGFFFHRGNQNTELDVRELRPQLILTFLGVRHSIDNRFMLGQVLGRYAQRHPEQFISYESISPAEYGRVLGKRLKVDCADDIFVVSPPMARYFEAEDRLASLTYIPSLSGYRRDVLEQMRMDGEVRYIPIGLGAFGLFCNLDLLEREKVGIPGNVQELLAACEHFMSRGVTPLASYGRAPLKALIIGHLFEPAILGNADRFFTELKTVPGKMEISLEESLEFLTLLRDRGYLNISGGEVRYSKELPESFVRGEIPFMLAGSWHAVQLARTSPSFRYAAYPLPVIEDGSIVVLGLDSPLAVNAKSKYLKQAESLVAFLSNSENIDLFTAGQGLLSPLRETPPPDRVLHPLWNGMEAGRGVFFSDIRLKHFIWDELDIAVDMILSGVQSGEVAERVLREASGAERW